MPLVRSKSNIRYSSRKLGINSGDPLETKIESGKLTYTRKAEMTVFLEAQQLALSFSTCCANKHPPRSCQRKQRPLGDCV